MLRRSLFALLALVILLAGFSFFILTSPIFFQWLIPQVVHQYYPQCQITSFKITKQKFSLPGKFEWQDIKVQLNLAETDYDVSLRNLDIAGLETILQKDGIVILDLNGLDIQSDHLKMNDLQSSLQVSLSERQLVGTQGFLKSPTAEYTPYRVQQFSVNFSGDDKSLSSQRFSARAYGGLLTGTMAFTFGPEVIYNVHLKLDNLAFNSLQETNNPIFTQVGGKVKGTIHAKGDPQNLHFIKINLDLTQGGEIKAALLSFILQYLPQSIQKKQLEALISSGGMVALETGKLELKSLKQTALSGIMRLSSQQLNLNINIPIDIIMDGKLQSLLDQWTTFLPQQ